MTDLLIYLIVAPLFTAALLGVPVLLWIRHDAAKDRRRHETRVG